jgi:hypothetical protein
MRRAVTLLAVLVIAAAAGATARTAVPKTTAGRFVVRYQATLTNTWSSVDTGRADPPGCDSSRESGALSSRVAGTARLLIAPEDGGLTFVWGVDPAYRRPLPALAAPIAFSLQMQETIDQSSCGGTVQTVPNPGCIAATRTGSVSFDAGGGSGAGFSRGRPHTVRFSWKYEPGWDETGCDDGLSLLGTALDDTAQPIDYRKLYRCAVAKAKACTVTLHASKGVPVHTVSAPTVIGGTITGDAQAQLDWTVTVTAVTR